MEENGWSGFSLEQLASKLREARVRRNLSIDDVGRELGIGPAYLEKIEAGDFTFMPAVYVLAYVKEYAELLGVGSPEIFKNCREVLLDRKPGKSPLTASDKVWAEGNPLDVAYKAYSKTRSLRFDLKRLVVFGAIAVAAVAAFFFFRMVFFAASSPPEPVLPDVLIDTDTAAVAERIVDSEFLPVLVSSADSLSRDSAAVDSVRSRTDVRSALIAREIARLADSEKVATAAPADGGKVLEVRVIDDQTWVKVIADDSARIYAGGQFKKGDVLRYEARNKFWVNIGRPSYVELYLDGKKIPPFSERTRVFE